MKKSASLPTGELLSIEALRGLAALCIVYYHAMLYAETYFPRYGLQPVVTNKAQWHEWLGATPVDLFFLISGFVLYRLTTTRTVSPGRFCYLRTSRIFGLYWLLSLIFLFTFGLTGDHHYSREYLLKSLLLIPALNDQGAPTPLIFVAWTLTYEILFYLTLTLALALKNTIPVFLTASVVISALYAAAQASPEHWFTLRWIGKDVILDFIPGMLLAMVLTKHRLHRKTGLALIAAGALLWIQQAVHLNHRLVDGALPAALILMGSLPFESALRKSPAGKLARLIGNSTYSIYLIQVFSLPLAYHILGKSHLIQHLSHPETLLAATIITLALGMAIYYTVEIRINALRKQVPQWTDTPTKN